jgi:tetratricopeptide (TPR) repeat protein
MPPDLQLLHPERAAHATIRGFLYQTCLGVLRWLELAPEEVLVCEGDEDLDRLIRGGGISEQVKAYSGSLGLADRAVSDSLRNFFLAYVALRRRGENRRFRFITTARQKRQRGGDRVDVLREWQEGERGAELVGAVRTLLADFNPPAVGPVEKRGMEVEESLAWLDSEPEGWRGFLDAVEWSFDAPDLVRVRQEIRNRLAVRESARHLPGDTLVDRLIAELLEASSRKDVRERVRTAADLEHLLAAAAAELASWAASPEAVQIRTVFDELDQIRRLLSDNTFELPPNPSPGKLLTAAYEVVPFEEDGRRSELDMLETWCGATEKRSVLLLTGAGGSGKTRLLIEWCRRLRHQGWHAGFLRPDRSEAHIDPLLEGVAPRLVVVDYAETRLGVVEPLLLKMGLEEQDREPKMRLVLLARQAADWWDRLSKSPQHPIEDLLLRSPSAVRITPLVEDGDGWRRSFTQAVAEFAQQLGRPVPENFPFPDLEAEKDLDRALYFFMAALAALSGERIETGREALELTLRHERQFWRGQVDELGLDGALAAAVVDDLEPAVVAVTLAGGAGDANHARSLIERVLSPARLQPYLLDAMVRFLRRLYGSSLEEGSRWLDPLLPDILGEQLVAECLSRDESFLTRFLAAAGRVEAHTALTVMTRLARRFPGASLWLRHALAAHLASLAEVALDVATETGDPAGLDLAKVLEESAPEDLVERLYGLFYDTGRYGASVPLREVALVVTASKIALLRVRAESAVDVVEPDVAGALNNLSICLSDLGRREEALAAIEESVEIRRELAVSRPDAFRPDLAMSLNSLAHHLSDLGRREEALAAINEAVEIQRELAASRSDAFRPDLAMSLNNLSNGLGNLGRREEALAAIEEAVKILRELAASRPDAFRPDLAMSLNNLSICQSYLGRREEALAAIEEAAEIRRELAASRPDAFRPALAMSLMNLSNRLGYLGRLEEALAAINEAVETQRELAASRPDAFRPALAMSLSSLSNHVSVLGRRDEALAAIHEAVEIQRELAISQPDAFRPDLATSLNNQSQRLSDLGRGEEALAAVMEAVGILKPYFMARPNAFRDWMGIIVGNYRELVEQAGSEVDPGLDPILRMLEAREADPMIR